MARGFRSTRRIAFFFLLVATAAVADDGLCARLHEIDGCVCTNERNGRAALIDCDIDFGIGSLTFANIDLEVEYDACEGTMSVDVRSPFEFGPESFTASEDGATIDPIDTGYTIDVGAFWGGTQDVMLVPEIDHEADSHYKIKMSIEAGTASVTIIDSEVDISDLCTDSDDGKIAGLSKGGFAGVMIGSFAGAGVLGFGAVMYSRKKSGSSSRVIAMQHVPTAKVVSSQ